jgi:hypothetical protein
MTPLNIHLKNFKKQKLDEYFHAISSLSEKRPLGRHRRRWENNITVDPLEMGCRGVNWIEQDHDRDIWRALVNAVMNFRVP